MRLGGRFSRGSSASRSQVGGLMGMIDEDRYCVDILTQIHAARRLHKVEEQVLRDHVERLR